jgi:hypothetical protein
VLFDALQATSFAIMPLARASVLLHKMCAYDHTNLLVEAKQRPVRIFVDTASPLEILVGKIVVECEAPGDIMATIVAGVRPHARDLEWRVKRCWFQHRDMEHCQLYQYSFEWDGELDNDTLFNPWSNHPTAAAGSREATEFSMVRLPPLLDCIMVSSPENFQVSLRGGWDAPVYNFRFFTRNTVIFRRPAEQPSN